MKKHILFLALLGFLLHFSNNVNAQSVGIGSSTFTPLNMLDVKGAMVIGSAYGGTNTAPANGLLIQGNTGIGNTNPASLFSVGASSQFQVNSTGAITATGLTSSGTIIFSGLASNGIVRTTGGIGTLSSSGGAINLASEVTGTLPVGNGGTGATTLTGMLKGNGASAITAITGTQYGIAFWSDANTLSSTAAGTSGYILKSNGSSAPTWLSTLPVANGGTGLTAIPSGILRGDGASTISGTTGTQYGIPYWATTSTLGTTAAGTSGQALISGGSGIPTWYAPTAGSVIFAGTSGVLNQNNSKFFWDNTNSRLGIGTASPSYPLQVQKTATAPAIMVGGAFSGQPRIQVYGLDADANAWMGLGTDMGGGPYEHSVYFPTSGPGKLTIGDYNGTTYNMRMTVLANGNVGIGTASPAEKLDIAGNINFQNLTTGRRDVRGTMGDNDFWSIGANATGSNAGVLEIATGDDGQSAGGAEPIVVRQYGPGSPWGGTLVRTAYLLDAYGNSSFPGNVGIGITSAASKLDVSGGDIRVSSQGYGLYLKDETSATNWQLHSHGDRLRTYNGAIEYTYLTTADISSSYISGTTNYVSKFTGANSIGNSSIYDNGNVGIGTTSPGSALHIGSTGWNANQLHFSSGWTAGGYHATIGSGYSGITASGIMLGTPHIPWRASYGAKMRYASDQAASYYWDLGMNGESGGSTDRFDLNRNNVNLLTVTNGGSVGIGTTNPAQGKLWVQDGEIWLTGNNNRLAFNTDNSPDATPNASIFASQNGINGASADIVFNTWNGASNAEIMRVRSNGNVGIGTASPGYRLDLASGTFGFGNANQRTETRDNAGLQGNAGAQSGFYETSSPSNYPAGATSWWHMIDTRHSNTGNNYAMQFAGSFFDQRLYFRKTNNNAATTWSQVPVAITGSIYAYTTVTIYSDDYIDIQWNASYYQPQFQQKLGSTIWWDVTWNMQNGSGTQYRDGDDIYAANNTWYYFYTDGGLNTSLNLGSGSSYGSDGTYWLGYESNYSAPIYSAYKIDIFFRGSAITYTITRIH